MIHRRLCVPTDLRGVGQHSKPEIRARVRWGVAFAKKKWYKLTFPPSGMRRAGTFRMEWFRHA